MKVIGITGGVGAGKSKVLKLIEDKCKCIIIRADELAKQLELKGEVCYLPLIKLLSESILNEDGDIDPAKMASAIFENDDKQILNRVNEIIHPEVKNRIISMIEEERRKDIIDYFFIEAALLIEDNYEKICDELWYIFADRETRSNRLKETRGYSDEKISGIMASQLDEDTFRQHCRVTIDNSGSLEDTIAQIDALLVQ